MSKVSWAGVSWARSRAIMHSSTGHRELGSRRRSGLKHLFVAGIGLLAAACGASPGAERAATPGVATSPGPAARPAATLLENYLRDAREAWKAKDTARFAALYTKDARITEIGEIGRASCRERV